VSEVVVEEIDKDLLQLDKRELAQRFNPAGGTRH
jgi:hypothetical protein